MNDERVGAERSVAEPPHVLLIEDDPAIVSLVGLGATDNRWPT